MAKGSVLPRAAVCACLFHLAQSVVFRSVADAESDGDMEELIRAKAQNWFQLAESGLQELDYRHKLECSVDEVAHVNAVIHIKKGKWKALCGILADRKEHSFLNSRASELASILDKVVPMLPRGINVKVPFSLHDGVTNLHEGNMRVPIFGATYHPRFSNIALPFAMGCQRTSYSSSTAYKNTPVVGWNEFAQKWFTCNSSLPRIKKAVFRGKALNRSSKYGACTSACSWRDNGRLLVHGLGQEHPDLFDTSVSNVDIFNISELHSKPKESEYMPMTNQLCDYQAILTIGNNLDWAERLRQSFYGNAVVVLPKGAPHEFFNTFLQPYKTHWPVKADLSDLTEQVGNIMSLTNLTQHLQAQKRFASTFLTEEFMLLYNRIMIEEYDSRANPWKRRHSVRPSSESKATLAQQARQALGVDGCLGSMSSHDCQQGQGPA